MKRHPWWSEAEAQLCDAAGHLNAQHGRMVTTTVWLLANPAEWQGDGVWTPEAYLAWRTGVAHATASKVVDVARRAGEFPECVATMCRGELSLDQMATIVRHAPGWADRQMSGMATQLSVPQISKVARQYPWDTDECGRPVDGGDVDVNGAGDEVADHPETDEGVEPAEAGAKCPEPGEASGEVDAGLSIASPAPGPADRAWFGWDDNGRFRLHLDVGADSGALLETAIAECSDQLFHERTDTGSVAQVDAVLEMAARSIESVPSAPRRNRFRANVHIDASSGAVTDARGRHVPSGPADRITCDALFSPVALVDGLPVSVGRSQYIVPDRTRRLIEHRDGGCRVPGCHSTGFVEVHHIVHWSNGGPTDTPNLISLCPKHHRLHHQGRLGISGDADRPSGSTGAVEFTDRHGVALRRSGADPNPPESPPPPIDGDYQHPRGERLETRWLHFHEQPALQHTPMQTHAPNPRHR